MRKGSVGPMVSQYAKVGLFFGGGLLINGRDSVDHAAKFHPNETIHGLEFRTLKFNWFYNFNF